MTTLVLLVFLVGFVAFAAGYAVAFARLRRAGAPMALPEVVPHAHAPEAEVADEALEPERVSFIPAAEEGTAAWAVEMTEIGERMRRAGVRLVVFAHGTFVGDDPLTLARTLEDSGAGDLARALRGFTREAIGRVLGDLSNYERDYVATFAKATGVESIDFTWSGENHHAARAHGAVRLARALALHGGGSLRPGDRVLLVGHSHAGQIFALLSQLMARAAGSEDLITAARVRGEDVGALEEHLALLRKCALDFVTLGTPPRYGFAQSAPVRMLHVVNHRGAAPRARSVLGLLHTREGDYVHQLGVPGSDFPAMSAGERALNARLDRVLGEGSDVRTWLRHVSRGMRVAPRGRTVLVDYGDQGRVVPNFVATGLGHAAYTRRDAMLFHARLIAGHFYPRGEAGAGGGWGLGVGVQKVKGWLGPVKAWASRQPSAPDG